MDVPALPDKYTSLSTVPSHRAGTVNVLGLVTDSMSVTPTRGPDQMSSFTITDDSGNSLLVRWFRPKAPDHPVPSPGDVMALHDAKVSSKSQCLRLASDVASRCPTGVVRP